MPKQSKSLAITASDVKPQKTDWIWNDLIAKGCVTVVAGDPGTAKAQIAVMMAAKVSKGAAWPCRGGSAPEGDVVMLVGEDDLAKRITPLLMAANANLKRVHLIRDCDYENFKPLNLFDKEDRSRIGEAIAGTKNPQLVIIDPITAFADSKLNNGPAARQLLAELTAAAIYYNIAIVLICHLTKSGGKKALSMIAGSSAIAAAARAVYMTTDDEPGSKYRLFTCVKNNLAPNNIALRYRVEPKKVGGVPTTWLKWHPKPLRMTADEALAKAKVNGSTPPRAIDVFLKGLLVDGKRGASEIFAKGGRSGFTEAQLRGAGTRLAVIKTNTGYGESKKWFWELPPPASKSS
jgi:putative DNA primase/helicase